jgi:NitT/TauT family transport system permease protein
VAFGLVAGVAIGSSTLVYDGFYPALIGFNTIPKVAVIPILVIWFGVAPFRPSSRRSCCRSFPSW